MIFSFPSVINSILHSTILVFVVWLMCINFKTIQIVGISTLVFSMFLLTIRMFLPLEFSFTREILSTEIYTKIDSFLRNDLLLFGITKISIMQTFFIIWIFGILFSCVKILYGHIKLKMQFDQTREDSTILVQAVKEKLANKIPSNLKIIRSDIVSSPIIYGLINPTIVLPYDDYTKKQLYYYILHELQHYKNNDLWFKLLFEVLCSIFWFYPPISKVFKKIYVNIMEFRVDLKITTSLSEIEHIEYLESIITVSKSALNQQQLSNYIGVLGSGKDDKVLTKRFSLVLGSQKAKQSVVVKICSYAFVLSLFALSFIFVVQPHYIKPIVEEYTFEIEDFSYIEKYSDNKHVIFNKEGEPLANLDEIPTVLNYLPVHEVEMEK